MPIHAVWFALKHADLKRVPPQEPQRPAFQLAAEAVECAYNLAPPSPARTAAIETWHRAAAAMTNSILWSETPNGAKPTKQERLNAHLAKVRADAPILLAQQMFEFARGKECRRGVRMAACVALSLLAIYASDVDRGHNHVLGLLEEAAATTDVGIRTRSFMRAVLGGDLRPADRRSERILVRRGRILLSRAEAEARKPSQEAGPPPRVTTKRRPVAFEMDVLSGSRDLRITLPGRSASAAFKFPNGKRLDPVTYDSRVGRVLIAAATDEEIDFATKGDRSRARRTVRESCGAALGIKIEKASAEFTHRVTLSPRLAKIARART